VTELQNEIATVARLEALPDILQAVCRLTGMGFAAVARVTAERWIACNVLDLIGFGLAAGGELEVSSTICDDIRDLRCAVVIDHVAEDPVYCDHPTPLMYGFQSYISMPLLRRDGSFFGTLFAIDPAPRAVSGPHTTATFRLLADLAALRIDDALLGQTDLAPQQRALRMERELADSAAALLDERQSAQLREQFIAVLGHDLRNPLSSISAGVSFIARAPGHAKVPAMLGIMEKSIARMDALIGNLLDLARGRLGGGMSVERRAEPQIATEFEQVVAELRAAWPARTIELSMAVRGPVYCDRIRIGQLLSNLVSNAITHGAPDQPVRIAVSDAQGPFELSVVNHGAPIAAHVLDNLFQPFFRGNGPHSQQGLGLGLFIAAQIAQAHGGTLEASSCEQLTRFTFRMPAAL
jgi:signal transduction histidine kinase